MLKIKVLGPGCANCKKLEQLTRKATLNLGIKAEIEKVTDYVDIMKYAIMSTPGLVINGKVVCSGRVPGEGEISAWITEALETA